MALFHFILALVTRLEDNSNINDFEPCIVQGPPISEQRQIHRRNIRRLYPPWGSQFLHFLLYMGHRCRHYDSLASQQDTQLARAG